MSNILFLTGTYLPNPGANGMALDLIIQELKNNGHKIIVLSTKNSEFENDFEVIDDIHIFRISMSKYSKAQRKNNNISTIKRRIKNVMYLWDFPNFDRDQVKKIVNKATYIIEDNQIQSVIAVNKPHANINAAYILKKKYPTLKFGAYYLDLLTGIKNPFGIPNGFYKLLISSSYRKTFNRLDYSLLPESFGDLDNYDLSKQYLSKLKFVDYPTYNNELNVKSVSNNLSSIYFSFAGTINYDYRNPEFFLKALSNIKIENSKLIINLYGANDCSNLIQKYSENISINDNGYTSKDLIYVDYINTDFLINISNIYTDVVPSKIFELFSVGKPIINFVKNPEDYTLNYFLKYPLCFNFYEWENFDEQVIKLQDFIEKNYNSRIDSETLDEIYKKNTPKHSVKVIEKAIK